MLITKEIAIKNYLDTHFGAQRIINIMIKWDDEKELYDNALVCGMTLDVARNFAQRNGLPFKKRPYYSTTKTNPETARVSAIKALRRMGWSMESIGLAFDISRQRIDQILISANRTTGNIAAKTPFNHNQNGCTTHPS